MRSIIERNSKGLRFHETKNGKIIIVDKQYIELVNEGELWDFEITKEFDRFCVGKPIQKIEEWDCNKGGVFYAPCIHYKCGKVSEIFHEAPTNAPENIKKVFNEYLQAHKKITDKKVEVASYDWKGWSQDQYGTYLKRTEHLNKRENLIQKRMEIIDERRRIADLPKNGIFVINDINYYVTAKTITQFDTVGSHTWKEASNDQRRMETIEMNLMVNPTEVLNPCEELKKIQNDFIQNELMFEKIYAEEIKIDEEIDQIDQEEMRYVLPDFDKDLVNEFFTDLTGLSRNFVPLAKKIDAYMKKLW